jgi:urease accessory protein
VKKIYLLGCLLTEPAWAHTGTGLAGGFASGFAHPFRGVDHLLAMVCVGLWGAFLGRPLLYVLPMVFPAMMAAGAIMGMFVLPMPPIEPGIAISVFVLGSVIAFAFEAPIWLASLIVAVFAVFHGYAHGKELPSAADPVGFSAGFVLASGLLHASGIGTGMISKTPHGAVTTRVIGAAIAVVGGWYFFRSVSV